MKKIIKNIIEDQNDNNIALTSESNKPLLYKDLKSLVSKIASQLAGNGISNKDRAAIVLPNGPFMASSFLSISSYMSAAPLNPSYKTDEYEFYLKDLNPKIVIIEPNSSNDVVHIDDTHGGGQAIQIDRLKGNLIGGSDPRKDGYAKGY